MIAWQDHAFGASPGACDAFAAAADYKLIMVLTGTCKRPSRWAKRILTTCKNLATCKEVDKCNILAGLKRDL